MNIKDRILLPTPPFFRRLRNIGISLAALSVAILTSPISFPVIVITVAQYVGIAGAVVSAISQFTISDELIGNKEFENELPNKKIKNSEE